jgi:putative ABC transport system permease protein
MSYIPLTWSDLALAGVLIFVNGLVSVVFRLGMERTLAIAAVRMVAQLALIGFILKLLFAQTQPIWTVLVALVMVAIAGHEVWSRQSGRLPGWRTFALGSGTLLFVGVLSSAYVIAVVIGLQPWYSPRVFVPVLGMILGNALTGVTLVLDSLTETAKSERNGIEARLALGASRFTAFEGPLRRSLRTAMLPVINAMAVSGVVALPGMMTGQILSGVDPVQASKYQIMIMATLAGSTALAVLIAAVGGIRLLTDDRHRLRLDRMTPARSA